MATTEAYSTTTVGEYPFGQPDPDAVLCATGALRILYDYQRAIERGATALILPSTLQDVACTVTTAHVLVDRAVIGSMRNTARPPTEPETLDFISTAEDGATIPPPPSENQVSYDRRMNDIGRLAKEPVFPPLQGFVLSAALLRAAATARHPWQLEEVRMVQQRFLPPLPTQGRITSDTIGVYA